MIVDLTLLKNVVGDDREMLLDMLDLFVEDIPAQVSNITTFAEQRKAVELGTEAHKLKATPQYVGFFEMFEVIKQLEMLGKSGNYTDEITELVSKLNDQLQEGLPLLEEKRKELAG